MGQSKGYFLLGIWMSLFWAVVFTLSVVIRRPVVGYICAWVNSHDRAWRKVYLQHLRLHNELYSFRKDVALALFDTYIDAAVQRELDALRAAGQTANPAVTASVAD